MNLVELEKKTLDELQDMARDQGLTGYTRLKKQDLVFRLLQAQTEKMGRFFRRGVLEIVEDGIGFLRQERLLPSLTVVYDFRAQSGSGLASVTYRMTQNFSATVGMAGFFGHYQTKTPPLWTVGIGNRVGRGANQAFVENGFAPIRARDELYLRIRYAF